ncbi:MAG: hypothetical protein HYV63_04760 [Candidatus Schekmanbacteria bacterium]|nr:hypothetical protein [Candidatus Schekmanbacteria bacterium]
MDFSVQSSLAFMLLATVICAYVGLSPRTRSSFPSFVVLTAIGAAGSWLHVFVRIADAAVLLPALWLTRLAAGPALLFFMVRFTRSRRRWDARAFAVVSAACAAGGAYLTIWRPPGMVAELIVLGCSAPPITLALLVLVRRQRRSYSRLERAQIRDLIKIIGVLAAAAVLSPFGSALSWWLDLTVPAMLVGALLFGRAVAGRQLFNLDDALGRGIVVFLTIFGLWVAYRGLGALWGNPPGPEVLVMALATLLLVGFYEPLRKLADVSLARLRRDPFQLQRRMVRLSREMLSVIDLPTLFAMVLEALHETTKIKRALLYWAPEEGDDLQLFPIVSERPRIERLERGKPAVQYLESRPEPISRDSLERQILTARNLRARKTLRAVTRTLTILSSDYAFPLVFQGAVYGHLYVQLGELSGLTKADVGALEAVVRQVAQSIEHARLYERIRARDRLASLGELATSLAHEIRNPLGAMKAAAQYLVAGASPEETREFLDIIVEEVNRLNKVVSLFLEVARPRKLELVPARIEDVVRRALRLIELEAKGLHLELDFADDLPNVALHEDSLEQALLNLFQNAAQAMPGGGTLRVRLDAVGSGGSVRVVIEDSGTGMDQAQLKRIFDPFFTTKERGTGMGLAIVDRIVAAHGGRIQVRSREGHGTTFVVILPGGGGAMPADRQRGGAGAVEGRDRRQQS